MKKEERENRQVRLESCLTKNGQIVANSSQNWLEMAKNGRTEKQGSVRGNLKKFAFLTVLPLLLLFVAACSSPSSGGGGTGSSTATAGAFTLTQSAVTPGTPGTGGTGGTVTLSWVEPTQANFAHVSITWTPAGGTTTQPLLVNKGTTTATIEGLTGNEYAFTGRTVDTDRETIATSEVLAVTGTFPRPNAITLTEIATIRDPSGRGSRVTLGWTAPPEKDFSHVLISWMPAGGTTTQPLRVNKGTSLAIISGLTADPTRFTAVVVNDSAKLSPTSTALAVTGIDVPPAPPTSLAANDVENATGQLGLSWTEPSDRDFSHVSITWTPTGGTTTQPLQVNKGTTTTTIAGFYDNKERTFKAVSVDATNNRSTTNAEITKTAKLRVAMFLLDEQTSLVGNWRNAAAPGGSRRCTTDFSGKSDRYVGTLKSLGYTKAVFFGSIAEYNFSATGKNISSEATRGLGHDSLTKTVLDMREIISIKPDGTIKNKFRTSSSVSTPVSKVFGNFANPTLPGGAFNNYPAEAISYLTGDTNTQYWSHTNPNTGMLSTGGAGELRCAGGPGAAGATAGSANLTSLSGSTGIANDISEGSQKCSDARPVLCVAR